MASRPRTENALLLTDVVVQLAPDAAAKLVSYIVAQGSFPTCRLACKKLRSFIDSNLHELKLNITYEDKQLWSQRIGMLALWPACSKLDIRIAPGHLSRSHHRPSVESGLLLPFAGLEAESLERIVELRVTMERTHERQHDGQDERCEFVAGLPSLLLLLPNLSSLDLAGHQHGRPESCPDVFNDRSFNGQQQQRFYRALSSLPLLESLNLPSSQGLQHIHVLAGSLKRLSVTLHDTKGVLSGPAAQALSNLPLLLDLRITRLNLPGDSQASRDGGLQPLLQNLPASLQSLELSGEIEGTPFDVGASLAPGCIQTASITSDRALPIKKCSRLAQLLLYILNRTYTASAAVHAVPVVQSTSGAVRLGSSSLGDKQQQQQQQRIRLRELRFDRMLLVRQTFSFPGEPRPPEVAELQQPEVAPLLQLLRAAERVSANWLSVRDREVGEAVRLFGLPARLVVLTGPSGFILDTGVRTGVERQGQQGMQQRGQQQQQRAAAAATELTAPARTVPAPLQQQGGHGEEAEQHQPNQQQQQQQRFPTAAEVAQAVLRRLTTTTAPQAAAAAEVGSSGDAGVPSTSAAAGASAREAAASGSSSRGGGNNRCSGSGRGRNSNGSSASIRNPSYANLILNPTGLLVVHGPSIAALAGRVPRTWGRARPAEGWTKLHGYMLGVAERTAELYRRRDGACMCVYQVLPAVLGAAVVECGIGAQVARGFVTAAVAAEEEEAAELVQQGGIWESVGVEVVPAGGVHVSVVSEEITGAERFQGRRLGAREAYFEALQQELQYLWDNRNRTSSSGSDHEGSSGSAATTSTTSNNNSSTCSTNNGSTSSNPTAASSSDLCWLQWAVSLGPQLWVDMAEPTRCLPA
ncbi:hypothetical protein Agub_g11605 [Astrephomene gubernaculifera]|uniref:Uncharacterized protein n=1 Tax=Astrephomene gubernaculifera TaxID=47775 RepID=A0AAD3DWV4_9CHLO|nr:hypothetical protein Agub_g11605 [Astrephomene gubernaculifera]